MVYELPHEHTIEIIRHARTLPERLTSSAPLANDEDAAEINHRLERWCSIAAQGDWPTFEKRLAWDGLNIDSVRRALGSVSVAADHTLPPWMETFKQVVRTVLSQQGFLDTLSAPTLFSSTPIPFEEFFIPFIKVARQKLLSCPPTSYNLLSPAAYTAFERQLVRSLSDISSQAIMRHFLAFRARSQPASLLGIFPKSSVELSRTCYTAFLKVMLAEEFVPFFSEYSVLARLTGTLIDRWADATAEFLIRLQTDWPDLEETFHIQSKQVVDVTPALSDFHNGRRSAIRLTFDSGVSLIYKPKDLSAEKAFYNLLGWFNQHNAVLPFKTCKVLNRSTYGWVEFVDRSPCNDEDAVRRYYQRAGNLLCVTYALAGADLHSENVIACGEYPVLIDAETLLQPQIADSEGDHDEPFDPSVITSQQLQNSVLNSGFLPYWEFTRDGSSHDVSGLGHHYEQNLPFRLPVWRDVNTDVMTLSYSYVQLQPPDTGPVLNNTSVAPDHYVEEFVDGFKQMYRFLIEQREPTLDGPLQDFTHLPIRFLLRPTAAYGILLQAAVNPKLLQEGIDHSIHLDFLARSLLSSKTKHDFWPLLGVEQQSLEQMDIPLFVTSTDSDSLVKNISAPHIFKESSFIRVVSRFKQLNDKDLQRQVGIIRASLHARLPVEPTSLPNSLDTIVPLDGALLTEQAIKIAADLQRCAISDDCSKTWLALSYVAQAERYRLQPIGDSLYDGCSGIALFLSALEKVAPTAGLRSLVLAVIHPLRLRLQQSNFDKKAIGIGGAAGLASIIYALTRISQFLDAPELLEDTQCAADLITLEDISLDEHLDITSGVAGTILGLLTFYKMTYQDEILDKAIYCGQHLLQTRTASASGQRAWLTLDHKFQTGFSHGAAGIAYALLRLYEVTSNQDFREAAREAVCYEKSVFSPDARNWPDFRITSPSNKLSFSTGWCNGAPGIGLARLGGLPILDTADIRSDIDTALQTTQGLDLIGPDHLCCGHCGWAEFMSLAATRLSRPELLETALKLVSWVVESSEQTGSYYLFANLPRGVYNPGFFQGTAGLGYEMLRLAHPQALPSVLLWE